MRDVLPTGGPQDDSVNPDFKTSNHIMKQHSLFTSLMVKDTGRCHRLLFNASLTLATLAVEQRENTVKTKSLWLEFNHILLVLHLFFHVPSIYGKK